MEWKVNNEKYDIGSLNDNERTELYRQCRENKLQIECLCQSNNNVFPKLHIKHNKNSGLFYPANNPSNSKKSINHSDDCIFNTYFRQHLKSKGILLNEEGKFVCVIKRKKNANGKTGSAATSSLTKRSETEQRNSVITSQTALRFLFLTLVQKYGVNRYIPSQQRNVHKRLYKAFCDTLINKKELKDIGYLAHEKYRYNYKKHQLVVGIGNRTDIEKEPGTVFYNIPLFALNNPSEKAMDLKVPKWIYEKATFTQANVNFGYFLLWRDYDQQDTLRDLELVFVPAEKETMIPIDSSFEEIMLCHLYNKKIQFKKPLVMVDGDDYLPDFILDQKLPHTVIEVAGLLHNEEYKTHLELKQQHYQSKGYKYLEWDVRRDLKAVIKDII